MDFPSRINEAIQKFSQSLIFTPVDEPLHGILEEATMAELETRRVLRLGYDLRDHLIGLIDVFSLHPAARRTRARKTGQGEKSFDKKFILPVDWRARRTDLKPSTVYDLAAFRNRWALFTQDVLSKMGPQDWDNIIVAGGSVTACLMETPVPLSERKLNENFQSDVYASSGVDIFFWGLTPKQAELKLQKIYEAVQRSAPWKTICVRSADSVSIHTEFPYRPVKIYLRLYGSPAEILFGLDIDAACCAYDGYQVLATPRAVVALVSQANVVDKSTIMRRSPDFEVRLAKYARRGFEIYLPTLDRERVKPSLYGKELQNFPHGLARLLVLEATIRRPHIYKNLRYPTAGDPIDDRAQLPKIPYGPVWDTQKIESMINDVEAELNSPHNPHNEGKTYHRHFFVVGDMVDCIAPGCMMCGLCLNPEELEETVSQGENPAIVQGRIRFLEGKPVSPTSIVVSDDWEAAAYSSEEQAKAAFVVGPNRYDNNDYNYEGQTETGIGLFE